MIGFIIVVVAALVSAFLPAGILPEFVRVPFQEGGLGMRLILFSFIVATWLTIDRIVVLARATLDGRGFVAQLVGLLRSGNTAGAVQICQTTDKPLARIIGAGLAEEARGEHAVLKAMDERAFGEMPLLEKRTGYLALMGNVATLMGLFGTIIGLIHSFGVVGQAREVGDKATQLAAGISEAMNCTAFGLFVGIYALVAYSILNGKTQRTLDETNHLTLRVFRAWKAGRGAEPSSPKAIGAPHAHLMTYAGLNAGGGGRKKKGVFANLQLTPLIDMFIVMVIFLLMTFSATGEIGAAAKDIKLPFAEQVEEMERALVVAISYPQGAPERGVITLEGSEVASARELRDDDSPDWKISKLTEQLEIHKNNWKVTHPNENFPGDLILQVDQNVDFKIIKKVMYSAGVAGYVNMMFAVTRKSAGGEGEGGGGHH